jgi:predicted nucleic-acid-binding protein
MNLLPKRNNALFEQGYIGNYLDRLKQLAREEVKGISSESMYSCSIEELREKLIEKYTLEIPVLKIEDLYMDEPEETTLYYQQRDFFSDGMVSASKKALKFTVCIPYEGKPTLFHYHPSSHTISDDLSVEIQNGLLCLKYEQEISDSAQIETLYKGHIAIIEQNLRNLTHDVNPYNDQIRTIIDSALVEREKEVGHAKAIIADIKIPIKRRGDIPNTYAIPEIKRKSPIAALAKFKASENPEPTLAQEEYEYILTVIKDMSLAMERSPQTFKKLTEPEIRDFFIILLNGHYQGMATGETFNGAGKTDILVRYENANAFIGECKIWSGQKDFSAAIDQLFGYVTWRDTKTALIIFNKGKDLTDVLEKIDSTVKSHANYKSEGQLSSAELKSESILNYKFSHPSDLGKEVIVTVLAYQVS